jgi:hypothetical protein
VDKNAKIPEDDWKKTWKSGTYHYLAPGYVLGTHEIERGEVTWHQLRTTEHRRFDRGAYTFWTIIERT